MLYNMTSPLPNYVLSCPPLEGQRNLLSNKGDDVHPCLQHAGFPLLKCLRLIFRTLGDLDLVVEGHEAEHSKHLNFCESMYM
jgi:hypothetical protein